MMRILCLLFIIIASVHGYFWSKEMTAESRYIAWKKQLVVPSASFRKKDRKYEVPEEIERDMHRSGTCAAPSKLYPSEFREKWSQEDGQMCLKIVETVLVKFDREMPQVGYCQGQAFLVRTIVTAMGLNFEHSYNIFAGVVTSLQYDDIYGGAMQGAELRMFQMDQLIKNYLPRLGGHFDRRGLIPQMYAMPWIMAMFNQDESLSIVDQVAILERMIERGWPFFFNLALGILHHLERKLLSSDAEQIVRILRNVKPHLPRGLITNLARTQKVTQQNLDFLESKFQN